MPPFLKLFWGFLIVLIDIRINGFDLLIDLVGYLLVVIGLGELARRNPMFGRARPFAFVLMMLSVFEFFTVQRIDETTPDVGLFGSTALAVVFSIALLVINLLLVFYICRGIAEMAGAGSDLAERAKMRWQFFLWAQVGAEALIAIAFVSTEALIGLALVAIVANLIAAILICGLLLRE